jgi:hypothetical protein
VAPVLPQFPPEALQFDLRGLVEEEPGHVRVDIGEIKTRADYGSAVQQLGLRLGVLRWLLVACCGVAESDIGAVGRLFVPAVGEGRPAPQQEEVDVQQEEVTRSVWRFSLHLHWL